MIIQLIINNFIILLIFSFLIIIKDWSCLQKFSSSHNFIPSLCHKQDHELWRILWLLKSQVFKEVPFNDWSIFKEVFHFIQTTADFNIDLTNFLVSLLIFSLKFFQWSMKIQEFRVLFIIMEFLIVFLWRIRLLTRSSVELDKLFEFSHCPL
jgi:hypothetical protein